MARTFVFVLLALIALACAKSIESNKDLPDHLNKPNPSKIVLDDDISLSIVNHQISLNGSNDHVLIETTNSAVLLSNFSSIKFVLNSTSNERDSLLVEGSKRFDEWFNFRNLNLDTYFYFFNVTNPDAVLEGAKPILKELGPFMYKKWKWYENLGWEDNENYINVKMFKKYESINSDDLNAIATIPNIPLLFIYDLIDTKGPNELSEETKIKLHKVFKDFPLFVTHKVGDLLFNGFQNQLTTYFQTYEARIRFYLKDFELKTYRIIKDGKFSVMGNKNNSNYGTWTVNTGKNGLDKIGQLYKIDGSTRGCWADDCGVIRGTDGLINTPFIRSASSIEVFIPEHYRTVEFKQHYEGESWKLFSIAKDTFDSGFNYSPNKCYLEDANDEIFQKDGVLKACSDSVASPIVTSNPHFVHGSDYFVNQMEGLKPVREDHDSFIKFGLYEHDIIEGEIRSQINFDTKSISRLRGLPRYIFPIFWLSEGFTKTVD